MKQSSILFFLIMLSGVTAHTHKFNIEFRNNTTHSLLMKIAFGSKLGNKDKKQTKQTHQVDPKEYFIKAGAHNRLIIEAPYKNTFVVAFAKNERIGFSEYLRTLDPVTKKNNIEIITFSFGEEQ
jgi:hypothetical protein